MMAFDLHGALDAPLDGRPLHLYRIDDRGFDELQIVVRQELARKRIEPVAAAFVLWAAEYYRREFDGGAFSWSFLTDPLDLDVDQGVLRELTARGLRMLKRPVDQHGNVTLPFWGSNTL